MNIVLNINSTNCILTVAGSVKLIKHRQIPVHNWRHLPIVTANTCKNNSLFALLTLEAVIRHFSFITR